MGRLALGIDCGSQYTKAVLLDGRTLVNSVRVPTGFDIEQAALEAYQEVLKGYDEGDVIAVAATGIFRSSIGFIETTINEVSSAAKGAHFTNPDTELVIDIGAESSRAVWLKDDGSVQKYSINDKCASGAGTFIETMARALQLDIGQMGEYSLRHTKDISINAQCVVFAESEVVSLIHQQEKIEDIAQGIHAGISSKVAALIRRESVADKIMLIGSTGINKGLVACLEAELGKELNVPDTHVFVSAIGAALSAANAQETNQGSLSQPEGDAR